MSCVEKLNMLFDKTNLLVSSMHGNPSLETGILSEI